MSRLARTTTDSAQRRTAESLSATLAESEEWAERSASRIRGFTSARSLPRHRSAVPPDARSRDLPTLEVGLLGLRSPRTWSGDSSDMSA